MSVGRDSNPPRADVIPTGKFRLLGSVVLQASLFMKSSPFQTYLRSKKDILLRTFSISFQANQINILLKLLMC